MAAVVSLTRQGGGQRLAGGGGEEHGGGSQPTDSRALDSRAQRRRRRGAHLRRQPLFPNAALSLHSLRASSTLSLSLPAPPLHSWEPPHDARISVHVSWATSVAVEVAHSHWSRAPSSGLPPCAQEREEEERKRDLTCGSYLLLFYYFPRNCHVSPTSISRGMKN